MWISPSDEAWLQASLPVHSGGIGVKSATLLAPSAFLSSAAGSNDLVKLLVPTYSPPQVLALAMEDWSQGHNSSPPSGSRAKQQKAWDEPRVQSCMQKLLDSAADNRSHARILAASCKESGYWLYALPITSLGLRMNDSVVRIAAGLRFGVPLCSPHLCQYCSEPVDELTTHGLSCRKSQGRHSCHAAVNVLIHRVLSSAGIPSHLEPKEVCISSNSRPDGITSVPWKCGRPLSWDFTCPDTFAASHVALASVDPGAVQ